MKILITGGAGYIGSHITEELQKKILINILKERKNEVANIYANNFKIKKELRWKAKYSNMNRIIKRCLKWEKKISNVQ